MVFNKIASMRISNNCKLKIKNDTTLDITIKNIKV